MGQKTLPSILIGPQTPPPPPPPPTYAVRLLVRAMGHNGPAPTDRIPASMAPARVSFRCEYCRQQVANRTCRCLSCGHTPEADRPRRCLIPPPPPNPPGRQQADQPSFLIAAATAGTIGLTIWLAMTQTQRFFRDLDKTVNGQRAQAREIMLEQRRQEERIRERIDALHRRMPSR